MIINYNDEMECNIQEYIELLKYSKVLKYAESLREDGKEDKAKYLKLLNYSVKVNWQKKSEYLKLMKNFVDLKIDGKQFVGKIHRANEKSVKVLKTDLKKLNTFQLNPKSEWTSEIDLGCDEFYPDFEPEFKFARDETFIADIIPQIQKYF